MKHTPAPWHVALNDRGTANEIWSYDGWVATLQPRIDDEEDANARLIAAAPELLAALEQIARLAHDGQVCAQVQHALGDIARAAIKRATR